MISPFTTQENGTFMLLELMVKLPEDLRIYELKQAIRQLDGTYLGKLKVAMLLQV